MFAAGIGVMPFRSMIRSLASRKAGTEVYLFYSSKSVEATAYYTELKKIALDWPAFHPVFTLTESAPPKWEGEIGRINAEMVKKYYPELEVVLITGYASIDTAVKATKMGAADYLPKPFTPDELTEITRKALERRKSGLSKKAINPPMIEPSDANDEKIDVDMPFSVKEMEQATSKEFVDKLTRSDIPQVKRTSSRTEFCNTGQRECRRLVLEGMECVGECPLEKKAREKASKSGKKVAFSTNIIDVDLPFNMSEIEEIEYFPNRVVRLMKLLTLTQLYRK